MRSIFTVTMHPLQGVAILEINPSVAFPIIDRLLGGPGQGLKDSRAPTEIDRSLPDAPARHFKNARQVGMPPRRARHE